MDDSEDGSRSDKTHLTAMVLSFTMGWFGWIGSQPQNCQATLATSCKKRKNHKTCTDT